MPRTVSVIIPTYNGGEFLVETVESVLSQTYRPLEIIVIDDGSTDGTPERLSAYRERVTLFRQSNAGVNSARNAGLGRSRGEFIALLDHDDVLSPEKIARQVRICEANPKAGMVACDGIQFGDPRVEGKGLIAPGVARIMRSARGTVFAMRAYERLIEANFLSCFSQTLIPRRVLTEIGGITMNALAASDHDTFIRISRRHSIVLHSDRLVRRRYSAGARSGPLDTRGITWSLMDIATLKDQFVECPQVLLPKLQGSIAARVDYICKTLASNPESCDSSFVIASFAKLMSLLPLDATVTATIRRLPAMYSEAIIEQSGIPSLRA